HAEAMAWPDAAPFVPHPHQPTEGRPAPEARDTPRRTFPSDPAAPSPEWPSVRTILAARQPSIEARAASKPASKPAAKRAAKRPVPTVGRPPDHWVVPLWLAWLPATAAALLLGLGGVGLAWTWGLDAQAAGLVADRLLKAGGRAGSESKEPFDTEAAPNASWWGSTAGHLYLRAVATDRSG